MNDLINSKAECEDEAADEAPHNNDHDDDKDLSDLLSRVQVASKHILAQIETQDQDFNKLAQFVEQRAEQRHHDHDD